MKLPKDGFPVRLEIPLWWSLRAVVTFKAFKVLDPSSEQSAESSDSDLFVIPEDYSKKDAILQNVYGFKSEHKEVLKTTRNNSPMDIVSDAGGDS